jgi:hypothetical protein
LGNNFFIESSSIFKDVAQLVAQFVYKKLLQKSKNYFFPLYQVKHCLKEHKNASKSQSENSRVSVC